MKTCQTCGIAKPLDDFYRHANTQDRRQQSCKKCDNARPRKVTDGRVVRNRARHRALADLTERHEDEYRALLALRLIEAQAEVEALAADPKAAEHYTPGEPVRLKPGKPVPGEKAGDRIDVARCPHCVKHHDRGHVCKSCGATPGGKGDALTEDHGRWVTGANGIKRWSA